jgi:hypothetical protein
MIAVAKSLIFIAVLRVRQVIVTSLTYRPSRRLGSAQSRRKTLA